MHKKIVLKNINPLNDVLFKSLMVNENNRQLVADVLSAITNIPSKDLFNAVYISGLEIPKRKLTERKKATDLAVLVDKKKILILEMNQFYKANMFSRNTSYAMTKIIEYTKVNDTDYPNVFLINFDNFNHYNTDKPILHFSLYEPDENIIENNLYHSYHLILDNILKDTYNIDNEIKEFAIFLKTNNIDKLEKKFKRSEKYMRAIETVNGLINVPDFVRDYTVEEQHNWELDYAKETAFEDGKNKGKTEGAKETSIEIAKNMLLENMDISLISKITKLSLEEIEKLK